MFKNVAGQKVTFYVYDSTTGKAKTGDAANLTGYVNKDYAGGVVLGDTSATEVDATNFPGQYIFDVAQAESNADTLQFGGKSSTANMVVVAVPMVVFTRPPNFSKLVVDTAGLADANAVKVGPTGGGTAQSARDLGGTLGVAGAGLTALGDTRVANLDATVSSRLAPAGTLATVTTAINVTNAPTAGDLTAAMKASVTTAATAATPVAASVSGAVGSIGAGGIAAASFAANAVDASAIAADAIGSSELAASAVNEIVAAVFARAFGTDYASMTFEQLVGIIVTALAGKLSGAAGTTITIRNLADTGNVIVATVDSNGNRSTIALTP